MNVVLPEKERLKKKQIIIYIVIILICVICILIAAYVQFYRRTNIIGNLFGVKKNVEGFGSKTQEQQQDLKANFNSIFDNNITNDNGSNNSKKIEEDKPLVYTKYDAKDSKVNNYDVELHIPYINISGETVAKYNQGIEDIFTNLARTVVNSENKNAVYNVEYTADVEEDILSLIVKANFKEGTKPQKVIIQTYNYDLRNNKEITLSEILKIKQLNEFDVQNKIHSEIKSEQDKAENLKSMGYDIYTRNLDSDIYKIEKSTEFYITKDTLYIIYAYGNNSETSQVDLVIL